MGDLRDRVTKLANDNPDLEPHLRTVLAAGVSMVSAVANAQQTFWNELVDEVQGSTGANLLRQGPNQSYASWWAVFDFQPPGVFYRVEMTTQFMWDGSNIHWTVTKNTPGGGSVARSGKLRATNPPARVAQSVQRSWDETLKRGAR